MENKVLSFLLQYDMVHPGDRIICAVSGGADSMALLWSLWMLREKLGITVEAAHFNHNLRGEESLRDARFVRNFCEFHDIPQHRSFHMKRIADNKCCFKSLIYHYFFCIF
ncbi:MAG: hypothetical protein II237_10740 [Clostridia bacterium]|nr:hypothetical protein [Clostridia bacterium]